METFFKFRPDDLILADCSNCLNLGEDLKKKLLECSEGEDPTTCDKMLPKGVLVWKEGRFVNDLGNKDPVNLP